MSEKKLTPAEAWEHVRALHPEVTHMVKADGGVFMTKADFSTCDAIIENGVIDWPSGVDRWPAAEKPRRPAKMPDDYGKPVWFRNGKHGLWLQGVLCGFCPKWDFAWCGEDGRAWDQCEVECDELKPARVEFDDPASDTQDASQWLRVAPGIHERMFAKSEPEPEWITPTNDHVGQAVHARNHPNSSWRVCILSHVYQSQPHRFLSSDNDRYEFARIRNPKYVAPKDSK